MVSKFEDDNTIPLVFQFDIPFLTAVKQTTSQDSVTQNKLLTDIQLYGKITGLSRKATLKAVRKKDARIITILEDYLNEEDTDENLNNIELKQESDKERESNKENQPFTFSNSNRQTKPKGRPKGTKRIRAGYEKDAVSLFSITNRQYKCGICDDMGHNKWNCSRA